MSLNLEQFAKLAGGRLIGDGTPLCTGASPPEEAGPGEVTMLDDPQRAAALAGCRAVAVVVTEPVETAGSALIVVADAHESFARIVAHFRPPIPVGTGMPHCGVHASAKVADSASIHPTAVVGAGVRVGERVRILPGAVVMPRCEIGDDCVLHAGVTLYEYSRLGRSVVVHAGSVIGAHGFGYRQHQGRHVPTAQLGYVEIESDVEIGACVTIDRGTYGATRIGEGTKIDNQVMVAHNCRIGRHNLLCSQVGIAGSCRTGDHVILAGQVGLKDHIALGDRAIVGAQAGVMEDCPGDEVYLGSPATAQREQMQIMAVQRRLPEMRRELKELRRELAQMRAQLAAVAGLENSRRAA